MAGCDEAYRLLVALCSKEYSDLPPEFVPIAKKYGYDVAKSALAHVLAITSPDKITEAMEIEYELGNSPFKDYITSLAKKTGIDPKQLLKSKAAREYYKWLRGANHGDGE